MQLASAAHHPAAPRVNKRRLLKMSKKSKSKGNKVGFIVLLVILVMLVLAIVGVCVDWISGKAYADSVLGGGETDSVFYKLGDLFDTFKDSDTEIAGTFRTMAAFGILTVILAGATTVLAGICKVLGWKLFKFILVIVSIVCVVSGVVSIITSFTFCDKFSVGGGFEDIFQLGTEYSPYIGAWLTAIGGTLAGLGGIAAAVKG